MVRDRTDPFKRGLDYLYEMRSLALQPDMIDLMPNHEQRVVVCEWIGNQITDINATLKALVTACHNCFYPWEQKPIQIYATPFADRFQIEGLCNLNTKPITLLIDVGRAEPEDWLALVMHEYAHAWAGSPGHHPRFASALSHLCLGFGYIPLDWKPELETKLRSYPFSRPPADPLAFWRGETPDWRSRLLHINPVQMIE